MEVSMSNPYPKQEDGRFGFRTGPARRKVIPSDSSDYQLEKDIEQKINNDSYKKETQIRSSKKQAIQKEIEEWEAICSDPYSSPYLREQALKKLPKLKDKLKKM